MAKSPKHPSKDAQKDAARVAQPVRAAGSLSPDTARAADSVPLPVGPFKVLPMQFGRYQVKKELGRGQMGAVYLALDTELDRLVALKVARVSESGSATLIKRMAVEAKAAARVDHPQICKVYDAGEIDGVRFIAMQYIDGEDLKQLMKRTGRRRDMDEAIRLSQQILRALEAAHENGIIHRDLKPENIMLNRRHEPVIMDFGLARKTVASSNAGLTQGMIVGTAAYMSPEQATGRAEDIDCRSDLYAVGVMLFEMLTGEWPFTGGAIEVMGKKCVQEPPSPLSLNPQLHAGLAAVCHKLIAKRKEDRYATCAEVINQLESIHLNSPPDFPRSLAAADLRTIPQNEAFPDLPYPPTPIPTTNSRSRKQTKRQNFDAAAWLAQARQKSWFFPVAAAFGSLPLLLFAVVMYVQLGKATVKIEIADPSLKVSFNKQELTIENDGEPITVRPGEQTLIVSRGTLGTETKSFTLNRGETKQLTLALVEGEVKLLDTAEYARLTSPPIVPPTVTPVPTIATSPPAATPAPTKQPSTSEPTPIPLTAPAVKTSSPQPPPPAASPFDATQAKSHQEAWAKHLGVPVTQVNSIEMKLSLIPAGEFQMGSADSRLLGDTRPVHRVRITKPFYMGSHEVTQDAFQRVTRNNPSQFRSSPQFPVESMSWESIQDFCRKLSALPEEQQAGRTYRLPTEAEWEYACRAGTITLFHYGNTINSVQANFDGDNPGLDLPHGPYLKRTARVGLYYPNAFGLYDMHGNVNEVVSDWYSPNYYSANTMTDPSGPSSGELGIARGGGWRDSAVPCAYRIKGPRATIQGDLGFRIVCDFGPVRPANSTAIKPVSFEQWLQDVPRLPADQQVEAVAKKLRELNPGFDGRMTPKLEQGVVTGLEFATDNVTNISPVRALTGLKHLSCRGSKDDRGRLSDLSPLKGLKLTSLHCGSSPPLVDLSPLNGMPLHFLYCGNSRVADLSPLKGMPLGTLWCESTQITDLSPLKNMPLNGLIIFNTRISSLAPLQGMPLTYLNCDATRVSDLTPLKGMRLETLSCSGTSVSNLSPVEGMPLVVFIFSPKNITQGISMIRDIRSIKTIGVSWSERLPTVDFWKKLDAGKYR